MSSYDAISPMEAARASLFRYTTNWTAGRCTPSIVRQSASYQNPSCAGTFRRSETGSPRRTTYPIRNKSDFFGPRLPFSVDYYLPIDRFRNQELTEELTNEAEVCEHRRID